MKSYKTMISTMLYVVLFFNTIQLSAQNAPIIKITPEITSGVKTSLVNNEIYTLKGSTLSYSVGVEGDGTIENGFWQLYYNDSKKEEGTSKGTLVFSNLETGKYSLSYKACRYWVENDSIEMRDTVVISNIPTITVYDRPTVVKKNEIQTVYHNRDFKLEISAVGADPNGWSYEWYSDGVLISTTAALQTKVSNTTSSVVNKQYRVVAINKCAGVEFAREELNFTVSVYPQVKVEQINNKIKVNNKKKFTLSANVTGGYPNGSTYVWEKDGNPVGEGLTFVWSEDNKSDLAKVYKYILRTTNKFNGEVWEEIETEYTVTVSAISISQKSGNAMQVYAYSGKDFTLDAVAEYSNLNDLTYEWKKADGTTIGDSAEISYKAEENIGSIVKSQEYTITVKNKKNGDSAVEIFTVYTYPKINVDYSTATDTVICGNNNLNFGVKVSGGYPNGWVYEWYKNGSLLKDETGSTLSIKESNKDQNFLEHSYTVIAKNMYNDIEWDKKELDFSAKIYPDVNVEDIVASDTILGFYKKGEQKLGAIFQGGYNEVGAWQFQWYLNNSLIPDFTESTYLYNEENLGSTTQTFNLKLVAINKLNDKIIYQGTRNYTVNLYSSINVEYNSVSDTVISGEKQVDFRVKATGGYENGWTYQWYRDGMLLNGYNTNNIIYNETNDSTNVECLKHTYKVVAINRYNGLEFDKAEKEYNVTVYPKITSPSRSVDMLETKQFTEGTPILLGVNAGAGGYANGWSYKWSDVTEGKNMNKQDSCMLKDFVDVKHNYSDSIKTIRQKQYKLEYTNVSPGGQLLDKGTFVFSVKIYRRPMKPLELIRKGIGASNIYIADMYSYSYNYSYIGFTDEELAEYEYKFLFGYGDENELITDANLRYASYTPEQVSERPWVRSYWIYDDGYIAASEKFHFGDTRGGVTNINDNIEDGIIKIQKNNFYVSLPSAMSATVNIYNINGSVIKTYIYEAKDEYNETIQTDFMNRGIYLIEVIVGNKREIRKFVIE